MPHTKERADKRPLLRDRSSAMMAVYDRVPSLAALAKRMGICKQAVSRWDEVPLERLTDVSRATRLPPSQIRPEHVREIQELERMYGGTCRPV